MMTHRWAVMEHSCGLPVMDCKHNPDCTCFRLLCNKGHSHVGAMRQVSVVVHFMIRLVLGTSCVQLLLVSAPELLQRSLSD